MRKSIIKKSLFICLLVLSAACFSYLSLYGSESAFVAQSLNYNTDLHSGAMSDVSGMKNILIKIIEIMMLKF